MNNPWHVKVGAVLLCAALLSACSNNSTETVPTESSTAEAAQSNEGAAGSQLASFDLTQEVEYDDDDSYADWTSATDLTRIHLNGTGASIEGSGAEVEGSTIKITSAGTYEVSGKLSDGQIVIAVEDKGTVRVVLNGAEIHNGENSPIYVEEAGKTIISLPEGTENLVSDGEKYVYPDATTDEPNATIFSHDDLTINGTGKLVVQANYNNGITSKDKLKITGGILEIHAVDDGLMGRDLVAVQEGNITIEADGHGIKTTNDAEDSLGFISIGGGTFDIKSGVDGVHSSGGILLEGGTLAIDAGDDGIHADVAIGIAGGTIDIANSYEGIEAPTIDISDGRITLKASDDGVNVASSTGELATGETTADGSAGNEGERPGNGGNPPDGSGAASTNRLTISGGYLSVDAEGDGLDANGSIAMSGGTVIVNGPTNNGNGALDYDGTFEMTGGFLVAAGSSGMAQATSEQSTQSGVLMTYPQTQAAGTLVHLEDSEGNEIVTFAPAKAYQSVFVSSPNMKQGTTYILSSGGTSTGSETNGLYDGGEYQGGTKVVEYEASSIVTWLNESGITEARSGMMGGPGGGGRGQGGPGVGQGGMGEGGQGGPGAGGGRVPPDGERPQRPQ
ncbi:carbohydrate-binding domain-containing protein [Cohnella herbarum]|uniref:Carbohydrate-binding domain-containing protein n=1 Tax=Cohnella herbarum TaxID=2728023 RepID=A0A7Z2ZP87_9BACL|nr:carbohydrate-binding domain-containing protein [Cohnella herbarum]QJD86630.1 carbohydrate-binding domain-containing protein [Cohnella herbarum]